MAACGARLNRQSVTRLKLEEEAQVAMKISIVRSFKADCDEMSVWVELGMKAIATKGGS